MGIAFARSQIIGRANGRSLPACVAYRHGKCIEDERQGKTHDYTSKTGIVSEGIELPKDAPEWMLDLGKLTNAIERREDRSTRRNEAQLAREYVIALPHELDSQQRESLLISFIKEAATSKGMVAMWAIHRPSLLGDNRNHHAHVMLTMREIDIKDRDGFGKKVRHWNSLKAMENFKEILEHQINNSLELEGIKEKISFICNDGREATLHMGHEANHLERQGIQTRIGNANRAIKGRNAERQRLKAALIEIEKFLIEQELEKGHSIAPPLATSNEVPLDRNAMLAALAKRNKELIAQEWELEQSRGLDRSR